MESGQRQVDPAVIDRDIEGDPDQRGDGAGHREFQADAGICRGAGHVSGFGFVGLAHAEGQHHEQHHDPDNHIGDDSADDTHGSDLFQFHKSSKEVFGMKE